MHKLEMISISFWKRVKIFSLLIGSKIMGPSVYTLCSIAGFLLIYVTSEVSLGYFLKINLLVSSACFLLGNAMYNLNDLFDRDSDRVNKRDKPLVVNREIQPKDVAIITSLLAFSALIPLMLVNIKVLIIGVICLGLGIAYSLPRLSLKRRSWGKPLVITSIIIISTMMGAFALNRCLSLLAYMSLSIGIFVLAVYHTHDIRDIEGDREKGCTTLPMLIGKKFTILIAITGYGLFTFLVFLSTLFFGFNYLFPMLVLLFSSLSIRRLMKIWPPKGTNKDYEDIRKMNRISIAAFSLLFPIGAL